MGYRKGLEHAEKEYSEQIPFIKERLEKLLEGGFTFMQLLDERIKVGEEYEMISLYVCDMCKPAPVKIKKITKDRRVIVFPLKTTLELFEDGCYAEFTPPFPYSDNPEEYIGEITSDCLIRKINFGGK